MSECSAPHGGEMSEWDGQVYGGRGSKEAGWSVHMKELGQICGGEVVDGLDLWVLNFDFELNTELNWKPVELLEDMGDVVDGGGIS